MRKIRYITFLFLAGTLLFSSCEKKRETAGLSKVTYYPDFTMKGDPVIFMAGGTTYTEPGVTATENGKPLTVNVSVAGDYFSYKAATVNTNASNKYIITYSATNSDGFPGTVSRTVYVVFTGDLVNSIEGLYTATIVRNGIADPQYSGLEYVMISKTGTNTYEISDAIGGYYDLGRGYGKAYRATGATVTANNISTNDFSYGPAFPVGAFGGSAQMSGMTVDPTAKTITFTTDWSFGYTFVVTLTQVKI